jgi:hypothetical protein
VADVRTKPGILNFGHCDLPFDLAQGGGESFDSAQDREPVERLVEPFGIWYLKFLITETRHLTPSVSNNMLLDKGP